jgi:hydrogenase maturation protein HypF
VDQRIKIRVTGIVQGVGFRPFVYSLATGLGLTGLVGNDVDGVFAEVEGPQAAIAEFLVALRRDAPPLASIEQITSRPMPTQNGAGFVIVASRANGARRTLISADTATCVDCLAELADPADRRYHYPFINCTNCGPRFTIISGVPYDRPLTTMAPFAMCELCAAEYHDPGNRRFHAQPTCCPACGPRLWLRTGATPADGTSSEGPFSLIKKAAGLLAAGQVLAIKGLGGYHLAVDATSERAAAALRARKHRADKPFAVLVADLAQARTLGLLDEVAQRSLTSRRRPIVLVPKAAAGRLAAAVAPGNGQIGIMLPYTPLHHLLARAVARPIVLTSGNVSDEPIAYLDADALERLAGLADAFLGHDRAIHLRTDDSVVRSQRGRESVLRRARGYAPEPLAVRAAFDRPVLACGAELKNTFCLASGNYAMISQHIGDLENAQTLRSFTEGIEHFCRLFDLKPAVIAHDLHPDYLSTKYALDQDATLVGVQHHHAHIASCLADNDAAGPVIGVAFDGTGYGTDGTIWGGEFLVGGFGEVERAGHLMPVPLPGGAAAIRQPWRMAAAYLAAAGGAGTDDDQPVRVRNADRWDAVIAMAERGINAPLTSSAGRLFDAVAAVLGVRDVINYEGQAAIELEQLAAPGDHGSYPVPVEAGPVLKVRGAELVAMVAADLRAGAARAVIAARFHRAVADVIVACCRLLADRTGLRTVALSGGVFQNVLLTEQVVAGLDGFTVLTHSRVPCNDGGISLGQAMVAQAVLAPVRAGQADEPVAPGGQAGAGLG